MALPPEDLQFAELAVAQGLCTRGQVDECVAQISRLLKAGVTPLPKLGELLARKGYLTPSAAEATARPPSSSGAATRIRAAGLPPEAAQAARDPANAVGKYFKVSRLGAGGMGEVWKAWDTDLARWVALKFLRNDDPGEQARFLREAQTAAALNHPNIAAVYESGQAGGKPFLAMQFVDGVTLAAVPRNDARRLATLVRDAALAVHHAHEKAVIHRDLKPSNLMVEGSRVYVMDFGLAKQTSVDSSLSISGAILGTPAYMAPEQARGEAGRVGPRSDVYALGATLYELLADRPPFQDTEVYALLKRVVEEDPVPLRRRSPRADRDLETIVMKCLEKDPDRRYAAARELAEDLDRYLEGKAILAHPPSAFYKIRKFVARRKAVLALGGAAVLAVAVLLPVWLREREERRVLGELTELRGRILVVQEWFRQPFRKPQEVRDALAREIRAVSRFIENHRDLPQGYYVRAHTAFLQGRHLAAEQDLREALRLDSDFTPAWTLLARLKLEEHERRRNGNSDPERAANRAAARPLLEEARKAVARGWKEGDDRTSLERWGLARTSEDLVIERLAQALRDHFVDEKSEQARSILLKAQEATPSEEFCRWLALLAPDPAERVRWYDRRVEMAPNYADVWVDRAWDRLEKNQLDGALTDFDAAIAIDPESVEALLGRAAIRMKRREREPALADLDRALKLEPRSLLVLLQGAAIRLRVNDLDGAERDSSQAIRLDPRIATGWINRSAVRLRKGDRNGALDDAGRAIDLSPEIAVTWANRGAARLELGEIDAALSDLEKALSLDPRTATAYATRSAAKLLRRDFPGAEADAAQAIALDPEEFMSWTNRAAARCETGDVHGAFEDATRAIELNPAGPLAYSNRGFALLRMGDALCAIEDFDRAIALRPGLALAYVNRSSARLLEEDPEGAVADASMAVEIDARGASGWAARAAALLDENPQAALEDAEQALSRDPRPPEFLVIRALARWKLKHPDQAVADFEEALRRGGPGWRLRDQVLEWAEEARKEK